MYMEDKKAIELIIDFMEIKNETENIEQLYKWIEKDGIDKVFVKVCDMYKNGI